jgi:molybdate transport system substrate-binding protein
MTGAAGSAIVDPVVLHAAGSLAAAFRMIARDFESAHGFPVHASFGPSGLLCDALLRGQPGDVFASANMEHPARLARAFRGRAVPFARNEMCVLSAPHLAVDTRSLLDAMLDPSIRLATSTPGSDPSGDYALAVFDRAERVRPGASALLYTRALRLTGAADSPQPPADRNAYAHLLETGQADIFLTYRTNALAACEDVPGLSLVALPEELAVSADYGLVALNRTRKTRALVDHIGSKHGQSILARFGFLSPAD